MVEKRWSSHILNNRKNITATTGILIEYHLKKVKESLADHHSLPALTQQHN